MRRFVVVLGSLALAMSAWAAPHGDLNIHIARDQQLTRCDQIEVTMAGQKVAVVEENLPTQSLRALKLVSGPNGGMRVTGWDGGYEVKACKASALGDAREVRVQLSGNEVSATGPAEGRWVVYYIVRAPRNASLDLRAINGEVSVRDVGGTITARTDNGPLALHGVSGTIDGTVINGPIAFSGGSGAVKLTSTNGPIAVTLTSADWSGGEVQAHTTNGPVSLRIPHDFRSSVVAESEGHGPVSCRGERCPSMRADVAHGEPLPRRIQLGSGPSVIHVSTVNGPVAVREVE